MSLATKKAPRATPKKSAVTAKIGLVEWFRPGEYERVKLVLADLRTLGVSELRTAISWADWYSSEGDGWYAWLLLRLSQEVRVLPCVLYTPPCLGVVPKTSAPPQKPKAYADFIDVMITRFGRYFDWIELWNQPNNLSEWDWRLDPGWQIFSEMIGGAAYWARSRGKKTVLAATYPSDPDWLGLMFERGVMEYIDAVGVHGFPSTSEYAWKGWTSAIRDVRMAIAQHNSKATVWITETGFSTWRREEGAQLCAFIEAVEATKAGVERVYWRGAHDVKPDLSSVDAFHADERSHHYGLKRADGSPKLLFRLWATGGLEAVREEAHRPKHPARVRNGKPKHVMITGGAGFIGSNLADRLLSSGRPVLLFDNLSRPGVENNLRWLRENHCENVQIEINDVRNADALRIAVRHAEQVFHFAAQVAVTTSVQDPVHDFEVNVRGALNLLEALRTLDNPPPLVFTSTNKVYGGLEDIALRLNCTRYLPVDSMLRSGVSEERSLDFHSPYGCSKGAADQYVLDYARTFGLPAVVFRMSCIYGPHQMGTEDQGWIAHFLIRAIEGRPIVLYGDGMQVRDVLFVDDLIDAFLLAQANIQTLSGQAFNIGGGLGNTISLLELIDLIGLIKGEKPRLSCAEWRPGDQRYYVSDTRKFKAATGWAPKVCIRQGVERLYRWLLESRGLSSPKTITARGSYEVFTAQPQMDV